MTYYYRWLTRAFPFTLFYYYVNVGVGVGDNDKRREGSKGDPANAINRD